MKRGGRLRPRTVLPILAVLLLAGCSQFSIYDQFKAINAPTSTPSPTPTPSTTPTAPAPPLVISPSVSGILVGGTEFFTASGGTAPYTFSVLSGGAGGTIDSSTGAYAAPNTAGTDTVQVTDADGKIANAKVTDVAVAPLKISPASVTLPAGTAIDYTFHASGGVPPYTYSRLSGSVGTIGSSTGVYSAPSSTTTSSIAGVAVTDSLGITAATASGAITFATAASGTMSVSPTSATVTEGDNFDFAITVNGGTTPYNATVTPTPAGTPSVNGQSINFAAGTAGTGYSLKVQDSTKPTAIKAPTVTVSVAPAAPSNLAATAGNDGIANLTWTNNSANVTSIEVQRAGGTGAYSTIATFTTTPWPTSYQDTGLTAATVYVYRIVAVFTGSTTLVSYSNESVITSQ